MFECISGYSGTSLDTKRRSLMIAERSLANGRAELSAAEQAALSVGADITSKI